MDCAKEQEETDFRWERNKPHPLCFPHIVESVLAYLGVPDLKKCRLVSSQYNEIACKALQSEETITFKSIPQLETYLINIKPISNRKLSLCPTSSLESDLTQSEYSFEEGTKIEEDDWPLFQGDEDSDDEKFNLNKVMNSLYGYSHRSFHFDYCDPSDEIEPFEYFFQHFGPQIKCLKYTTDLLPYNFPKTLGHMGEVWQDRLSNLEELSLEMKWGVPAHLFPDLGQDEDVRSRYPQVLLPSLKRLHLDVLLTDRDADRAELFLRQLLSITPNIEEISIPGSKRFFDDYINVILARVIMATEVPQLSVLNFCLALSDAQMRLLSDKGLPLSTLILDLEDLQFEPEGENMNLLDNDEDHEEVVNDDEDDEIRPDFPLQNQQQNRRPSFTPVSKRTLERFLNSLASTLSSLHICFPQSPRHNLHSIKFQEEMTQLKFLALGYFAGSSRILDQLPALKKLELWNVQFRDCLSLGKAVPDRYEHIASVIT